jgi:two-component system, sensor histidine kinase and response regulator
MKLLFVDNSRTIRAGMSMILSQKGHTVQTVATGQEAIEYLKTDASAFDLVIMDLYMPLMNGHEAAKIIRELPDACKTIPIIALTASEDPRDLEMAKNAGMNEFVMKSDDNQALFDILDRYHCQHDNS